MNSTLSTTGAITVSPRPASSWLGRMARPAVRARAAWLRRAELHRSRDYLAELYERRREAERLRDERFGYATLARII